MWKMPIVTVILALLSASVTAGEVKIVKVQAMKRASGWHFNVTLKHDDEGWNHYADAWRIVTADGKELGTRTLYHPHVDEQPFTRGLPEVIIPSGMKSVFVEAHDKVHGWAKQRYEVRLK
ncbi:MAG: hypothetical protein OEZ68_05000 [Gammaproteobacteria bacterium]|nr:hypothetical protein [Gammaproteobacteria bacterium]MDH5800146.1 hypothetical protein [Gammaproteobacteria bacterium]